MVRASRVCPGACRRRSSQGSTGTQHGIISVQYTRNHCQKLITINLYLSCHYFRVQRTNKAINISMFENHSDNHGSHLQTLYKASRLGQGREAVRHGSPLNQFDMCPLFVALSRIRVGLRICKHFLPLPLSLGSQSHGSS